ncbi:MAG: hypothetical protein IKL13_01225 [Clostridia bacterium]|nr:hypothetical protein [Clostridia bacterium]
MIRQGLSLHYRYAAADGFMLWAERRNEMNKGYLHHRANTMARIMTALGGLGAVAIVLLRVWISPSQRDMDTGLFATNWPVIGLMLLILLALGACVYLTRGGSRQEITGKPSLVLSMTLLAVGGALTLFAAVEMLARLGVLPFGTAAANAADVAAPLGTLLPWLQWAFCLLGGVALVGLGLKLASEGVTRRGMSRWGVLAPVLWVWFTLANYEMSYASMIRLSDGFFTLGMYIMEMLFLFFFARYIAGVGKVGFGTLLFFSSGATLFALSAPLVRLAMYLLQDGEAFAAAGAAGVLDLAIGLLALAVSITLCQSLSAAPASETEEEPEWSDEAEGVSVADLIEVSADEEGLSEE